MKNLLTSRRLRAGLLIAALAVLGVMPTSATRAATNAVTCSGPSTMTGYYSGGRRYTNPVAVACSGPATIRVWGNLKINGTQQASADVTCQAATSCTMPSMSAPAASVNTLWSTSYQYSFRY